MASLSPPTAVAAEASARTGAPACRPRRSLARSRLIRVSATRCGPVPAATAPSGPARMPGRRRPAPAGGGARVTGQPAHFSPVPSA